MNEEKILTFLFQLNSNKYETSITGEKCAFYSYCLNYIIAKITPKLNKIIKDYQKDKETLEKLIQSKEKIISFLINLNKNMDTLKEYNEPIIEENKINEYVNNRVNNSVNEEINLKQIRENLEKLVKENINWTQKKN